MKRRFQVAVTQILDIEVEADKFGPDFIEEFSSYMFHINSLEDVISHIARNFVVNGAEHFVEGVGELKEEGVKIVEVDDFTDIEQEITLK